MLEIRAKADRKVPAFVFYCIQVKKIKKVLAFILIFVYNHKCCDLDSVEA